MDSFREKWMWFWVAIWTVGVAIGCYFFVNHSSTGLGFIGGGLVLLLELVLFATLHGWAKERIPAKQAAAFRGWIYVLILGGLLLLLSPRNLDINSPEIFLLFIGASFVLLATIDIIIIIFRRYL